MDRPRVPALANLTDFMTDQSAISRTGSKAMSLREHVKRTMSLSGPVIVARSGILVLFTVDTVMVGQIGGEELAFLGLGMSIQGVIMMICIGLLQGTMILSSQAYGADDFKSCGRAWRTGSYHALLLGLVFGLICLAGENLLLLFGQSASLAEGGGRATLHFGWGMPAMLLYVTASYFLESIQRPGVGMMVMLGVNILNFALNGMLIFGWLGTDLELGAEGVVIATSIVRWVAAISMIAYIIVLPLRLGDDRFGLRAKLVELLQEASQMGGAMGKKLRSLGAATGLAYGLEAAAFSSLVFMAGLIGPAALAAHQITNNSVALLVMVSIGMAAATAVRVGNAVGRGDEHGIRMAGWVGLGLIAIILAGPSILLLIMPLSIASLYVKEVAVLEIAQWTMLAAGVFIVADGMMNVIMGALRGMGDVWVPMFMHIFSFWCIGVPFAWAAAFYLGYGAVGLQMGIGVAVFLSVVAQVTRFAIVSKRAIKRT
jgi:MATE family, multidrug efflux pump